ncbi:hypothetical protein PG997_007007 [Apiospora hydei]|uniref:DUF6536 domain-containing protein n=1 Tax=Apiospora hydei TaxID=1337664 RepID=A0ABR1WQA9_9PEZI
MHELAILSPADNAASEERLLPQATLATEPPLPGPLEHDLVEDTSMSASNEQPFRCSVFASQDALALWFPRVKETNTRRIRWSKRRRALGLQLGIAVIVFFANLGLTIFAFTHFGSQNGVGLLYAGDCETVKQLDRWLHLLINVLSTGLLSASNYCMQLQAAPTREELDEAHKKGGLDGHRYLELEKYTPHQPPQTDHLGPSGFELCADTSDVGCSTESYNSAVFQSLGSNSYTVAVVKDSFLQGAPSTSRCPNGTVRVTQGGTRGE